MTESIELGACYDRRSKEAVAAARKLAAIYESRGEALPLVELVMLMANIIEADSDLLQLKAAREAVLEGELREIKDVLASTARTLVRRES
jgi:hypothetical protein